MYVYRESTGTNTRLLSEGSCHLRDKIRVIVRFLSFHLSCTTRKSETSRLRLEYNLMRVRCVIVSQFVSDHHSTTVRFIYESIVLARYQTTPEAFHRDCLAVREQPNHHSTIPSWVHRSFGSVSSAVSDHTRSFLVVRFRPHAPSLFWFDLYH